MYFGKIEFELNFLRRFFFRRFFFRRIVKEILEKFLKSQEFFIQFYVYIYRNNIKLFEAIDLAESK